MKGIIMGGDHPKLILDGIKTMTRRVIKPQPPKPLIHRTVKGRSDLEYWYWADEENETIHPVKCSYGQVGDRLWVKETHKYLELESDYPDYEAVVEYRTGETISVEKVLDPDQWEEARKGVWRPSIHLHRWASRILLEITGIRVERLQEITEKDAIAEGIEPFKYDLVHLDKLPVQKYRDLWDSLNAKRGYGWEVNPWVWVISFKIVEQLIDRGE